MTDFNWMLWIVTPIIIVYYLYRHVWPAVRKFIRLFQGIRINPRSHLTEAEYKKLSVGSLYALQQGAYLNSLTLDIKDKLPTILADWWGICNAQDAKQTLEYLGKKGFAYYFPHVYQAFLLDDEEAKDRFSSNTWIVRRIMTKPWNNCTISKIATMNCWSVVLSLVGKTYCATV